MESKNKQAGMPSDENTPLTFEQSLRMYIDGCREFTGRRAETDKMLAEMDFKAGYDHCLNNQKKLSPLPKSEAEVEPKIKGMDADELRDLFKEKTGTEWENSQGEPDIDYVQWLELLVKEKQEASQRWMKKASELKSQLRLLSAPPKQLTDEEIVDIAFEFGYGCDPSKGNKQLEAIHDAFVAGMKKCRELAPSKGKYSEWISVEDRLPEHNQQVLATEEGTDVCWISWLTPHKSIWGSGACKATHWMPLPEAPESSNTNPNKK